MPFLWQVRDLMMKTSGPSQKREVILIFSLWPHNGLWFSLAVKYRQGEFTKCLPSAQSYYDPNWIHTRLQQSCFMSNWLENNPHLFLPSGLYGDRRQLIPEPTCNLPWPAPSQDLPLLPGKSTTLQNLSPYHTFEWSIPCMLSSLQSGLLKSRFALARSKPVFLPWYLCFHLTGNSALRLLPYLSHISISMYVYNGYLFLVFLLAWFVERKGRLLLR